LDLIGKQLDDNHLIHWCDDSRLIIT